MSRWRQCTLGDVIELKRGYDLPKRLRTPGPYPIVSSSGISGSHIEAKVKGPGVVTGRYGTLGEVFYLEDDFWPLNTALYVRDFKGNDREFISYFLRTIDFFAFSDKAAVPGVNRNHVHQASVRVPDVAEQKRIANILGTLDDKIELNRRMNRTLEAIARAIFKSWFVDFDPVHAKAEGREPVGMDPETAALFPDSFRDSPLGKIPEGWEVRTLGEVAEVADCLHSKKPPERESGKLLLQVYNVGQRGALDLAQPYWISDDDYMEWIRRIELAPGDMVITKTGRVGAVAQVPSGVRAAIGRNMVGIRGNAGVTAPRFLRCLLISSWMRREIERLTSDGTILRSLHVKAIEKLRLTTPPSELLEAFESTCDSILGLTELNTSVSYCLGQTRDALLPEFLSGRLSQGGGGPRTEEK